MKKYLIFDLDWTLINSTHEILDIIEGYIAEKYPEYLETAKYYIKNHLGMSLQEQLVKILNNEQEAIKATKEIYSLLNNLRDKLHFIDWVEEKILELSKNYKLFLTTWSSTSFAESALKWWWIYECFELIYWSDQILKWQKHLDIFNEYSLDKDFYKNSIYIWDWEMDKIFATQAWIDFIRIWTKWTKDENRIKSVTEINTILDKIK